MIEGTVCNPVTNTLINMDTIHLAIDPYPIEVVEGNIINIHFEVEVLKEIAKGARFKVLATYEDKPGFLPCATIVSMSFLKLDSKKFLLIKDQLWFSNHLNFPNVGQRTARILRL